jgi:hypothetical protein
MPLHDHPSACTSASVVSGATRLDSMYSCPGRFSLLQSLLMLQPHVFQGLDGSMSWVVGLSNNSYKPITNTAWLRARRCKLQKRVHSTRSRM